MEVKDPLSGVLEADGDVKATHVYGPDGLVASNAKVAGVSGQPWYYYTFDMQGNVSQKFNSSQAIQSTRLLNAWGVGMESANPRSPDNFGYNAKWGYYLDRETELYVTQHRMYDASTGRWLNRDPIGYSGGMNLYGYCGGGPVGSADPTGLDAEKPAMIPAMAAAEAEVGSVAAEAADLALAKAVGAIESAAPLITSATARAAGTAAVTAVANLANGPQGQSRIRMIGDECSAALTRMTELIAKAKEIYPKLANLVQNHHVAPMYLGGAKNGQTVPVNAAYHQQITNAFREWWKYGQGKVPNEEVFNDIWREVYTEYPLPGIDPGAPPRRF